MKKHKIEFKPEVVAQALAEWLKSRDYPGPEDFTHGQILVKDESVFMVWEDEDAKA